MRGAWTSTVHRPLSRVHPAHQGGVAQVPTPWRESRIGRWPSAERHSPTQTATVSSCQYRQDRRNSAAFGRVTHTCRASARHPHEAHGIDFRGAQRLIDPPRLVAHHRGFRLQGGARGRWGGCFIAAPPRGRWPTGLANERGQGLARFRRCMLLESSVVAQALRHDSSLRGWSRPPRVERGEWSQSGR